MFFGRGILRLIVSTFFYATFILETERSAIVLVQGSLIGRSCLLPNSRI